MQILRTEESRYLIVLDDGVSYAWNADDEGIVKSLQDPSDTTYSATIIHNAGRPMINVQNADGEDVLRQEIKPWASRFVPGWHKDPARL